MSDIPYVCQKCGRFCIKGSNEAPEWLVHPHHADADLLVIRCPQHITEWSLRQAGIPRTTKVRRWRALTRAKDAALRDTTPQPTWHPFPFPQEAMEAKNGIPTRQT